MPPSRRYVELMNARYQRLLDTAQAEWPAADLVVSFHGEWVASIAVKPPQARDRWVTGDGQTLELALAELEKALGLDRWTG